MREEFEAWLIDRAEDSTGFILPDMEPNYDNPEIAAMLDAWQASRQALEVELPESFEMDDFEAYDAPDVIESIRAAGIHIKGVL